MAVPGPEPAPPLSRVTLKLPEDLSVEFFQELAGDIGSEPLEKLRPEAPSVWLKMKVGAVRQASFFLKIGGAVLGFLIFVAAIWLFGTAALHFPFLAILVPVLFFALRRVWRNMQFGGGARPVRPGDGGIGREEETATGPSGFLNYLREWFRRQSKALAEARMSEIERLMKLLREDPAKGLRYALPLTGGESARGYAATPGSRLSLRNPVLGAGSGAAPVDNWNLDTQTQWKLHQQYRELAASESAAGRHDRAAYIYGNLLGLWNQAAQELAAGGRPLEAARLYQVKLKNPKAAAECLEKAGLLAEAAALFSELGLHDRAGDLWHRLGRRDEAFREWLAAIKTSPHRWQAARIIEKKLREPGRAAGLLASGWPGTDEEEECLQKHFELLGRYGATEEALAQCERLGQERSNFSSPQALGNILVRLQVARLDRSVKERLAALGRRLVVEELARKGSPSQQRKILDLLPKLDAADPLLKRDVQVYRNQSIKKAELPVRKRLEQVVEAKTTYALGPLGEVLDFAGVDEDHWFVLEVDRHDRRLFLRTPGDTVNLGYNKARRGWVIPRKRARETRVALGGGGLVREFGTREPGGDKPWQHRPWEVTDKLLGYCADQRGPLCVLTGGSNGFLDLGIFSWDGDLIRMRPLGWAATPDDENRKLPAALFGDRLVFALDHHLYSLSLEDGEEKMEACNMPDTVTAIAMARPKEVLYLAAVWGSDVVLLQPEKGWEPVQLECGFLEPPAVAFLADGNLAVVSSHRGALYDPENPNRILAEFKIPPGAIAVLGCAALGVSSLAVLHTDGEDGFVTTYDLHA